MDTQGAFDKQGKTRSSDIIAFSTLLSSIQIYNIQKHVNENDLEPLSVLILQYFMFFLKHDLRTFINLTYVRLTVVFTLLYNKDVLF